MGTRAGPLPGKLFPGDLDDAGLPVKVDGVPLDGAALARLSYLAHLAVLLWWLLDRSPQQRATAALLGLTERAGRGGRFGRNLCPDLLDFLAISLAHNGAREVCGLQPSARLAGPIRLSQ